MIGFGQNVNIPDANFKGCLTNGSHSTSNTGNLDGNLDGEIQLSEAAIYYGNIHCENMNISDLAGIEAFTTLTGLYIDGNQITTLDISQNTALTAVFCNNNQLSNVFINNNLETLWCDNNQLTSLDVSNATSLGQLFCNRNLLTSLNITGATSLYALGCDNNELTSLDLSSNVGLYEIDCGGNQLTSLNLSNNIVLEHLMCDSNQLTTLDVRNGNNTSMTQYDAMNTLCNPNLFCINVDNTTWSTSNWTMIDPQHYFSNNCPPSAIQEHTINKEVLKVTDLLGRETKQTNQPLFYIYDDGTVEKRIVIE